MLSTSLVFIAGKTGSTRMSVIHTPRKALDHTLGPASHALWTLLCLFVARGIVCADM